MKVPASRRDALPFPFHCGNCTISFFSSFPETFAQGALCLKPPSPPSSSSEVSIGSSSPFAALEEEAIALVVPVGFMRKECE